MSRAGWLRAVVLVTCALFGVPAAHAHGALPNAHTITARIGAPGELWIETNFGLVVSHDDGATWDWICEEAPGFTGHVDVLVTQDGRVLAAGFDGLIVSDDGGCSWSKDPLFADLSPTEIEASPADPARLFVTTARYQNTNGLFRSDDGGYTWTFTHLRNAGLLFSSIRIAPSNASRVYVSAWWAVGTPEVVLFRSDDGGDSFTEIRLTSALPAGAFTVWAVDPSDPDVVYASLVESSGEGNTRLLRSGDAGATFQTVFTGPAPLNGLSVSEDGSTVFLGTDTGFYRSIDGGRTFSQLPAPTANASPLLDEGTLYACASQLKDGFALARSADRGDTLTTVLRLSDIRGPLDCPAGSSTADVCPKFWPVVKDSFPKGPVADGGTPADGGEPPPPPPPQGCGCSDVAGAPLWLMSLLVLGVAGRRDSRRRFLR
ncbi:MAG: hypothetical protein IRZ16_11700 [Myxococcaceae bacterium]|nr:hypothetical protein [Myxococcaceae bacterium]